MQPNSDHAYRLRLVEGYIEEAAQDLHQSRWRSCVDNSQLAVENGAKAALALIGPVGRTHDPGPLLDRALIDGLFPAEVQSLVAQIAARAKQLGPEVHIRSDYGVEKEHKTPWELFDEKEARRALQIAEETLQLVKHLTR